jgi:hypothetical protein
MERREDTMEAKKVERSRGPFVDQHVFLNACECRQTWRKKEKENHAFL